MKVMQRLMKNLNKDKIHKGFFHKTRREDEAQDLAKQELIWAIGRDASKDWECSNIEEEA
jgi:hypothetical protein